MAEVSEFQQVAALLSLEIDILESLGNDKKITADEYRDHIKLIIQRRNEMVSDKKLRDQRFQAYQMLAYMINNAKE